MTSRSKGQKVMDYVTTMTMGRGRGGQRLYCPKLCDVNYERPLCRNIVTLTLTVTELLR